MLVYDNLACSLTLAPIGSSVSAGLEAAVLRTIGNRWIIAAVCVVGGLLSPVLAGYAPLTGDPELMYQPIKMELSRTLASGRLPYWSDYFGLGIPLVAESHIAAFYPPNWLFYRIWSVPTAYRLMLWIHALALVVSTFAYARVLGIGSPGSALAAISFGLCGFQAVHALHEPFYHAMPYLPFCLLAADRYAATGKRCWLAALALSWGLQLTLGHFQIQMWTGGLALFAGSWRALTCRVGRGRALGRTAGLVLGLAWGAAIACVQLALTWELTRVASFDRPANFLLNYAFPPAHLAQFALPEVFLGRPAGLGDAYWNSHQTTADEACAYVGVVPIILACVGAVARPRPRILNVWLVVIAVALVLATMPRWSPDLYMQVLRLPGIGWFRAPARYTLLASLGLTLLAGRGLDQVIVPRRFWAGFALAGVAGVGAWAWSIYWTSFKPVQQGLVSDTLVVRFVCAGLVWILGMLAIVGWRRNWLGIWAPVLVTVVELATLFYVGPVRWHWTFDLPRESPVLARLAALPDAALIAGRIFNLPIYAGRKIAYPNLGIVPPPPNYLLEMTTTPPDRNSYFDRRWQRRFGVSHGVWGSKDNVNGIDVIAEIEDPVLDRILEGTSTPRRGGLGPWKLVRMPDPFPPTWIARGIYKADDWPELSTELSKADVLDTAWFLPEDFPGPFSDPVARVVKVESWDGQTAVVSHDGSCILILRRTHYPGWTYQVNDGPEQPVLRVDGGLQGVRLTGAGPSRVVVRYQPTNLVRGKIVSLAATTLAVLVVLTMGLKALYARRLSAARARS
jgi:hypothetical protein